MQHEYSRPGSSGDGSGSSSRRRSGGSGGGVEMDISLL